MAMHSSGLILSRLCCRVVATARTLIDTPKKLLMKKNIAWTSAMRLTFTSGVCTGWAVLLAWCLPVLLQAQEENLGAMFLQEAVGARTSALGEAFVAVAEDANAVYWNPAGLVRVNRRELLATHTEFIQGFRDEYFAFCLPWSSRDAFGANLYFSYADLERINDAMESAGTFSVYDAYLGAAWSHALDKHYALGGSLKGIYQVVDAWSAWSMAADVGGSAQDIVDKLSLGLVVRNLGKPMKFIDQNHPLPITLSAGAAYRMFSDRLLLSLELDKPLEQEMTFHLGAEYNLEDVLFVRAGYKYSQFGNDLGAWSGFSCGVGIEIWDYKLDYAYSPYADLGDVHRISLTFPFGQNVVEEEKIVQRLEKQIKSKQEGILLNYIQEGDRCQRQAHYDQALKAYLRARMLNPDYPGLAEKIQQADEKMKSAAVREHLDQGKQAFAAQDYLNALIEWSKGLEAAPNDSELQRWIKLANDKLSEEKIANTAAKNSQAINEYFAKGLAYLENRRYTEAIAVWNKVLDLDPGNPPVEKYLRIAKNKLLAEISDLLAEAEDHWQHEAWVEAAGNWRRVLDLDPQQADAARQLKTNEPKLKQLANDYFIQGMEKYVRNQLEDAITDWKTVLILDPENAKSGKNIEHAQRKLEELKQLK